MVPETKQSACSTARPKKEKKGQVSLWKVIVTLQTALPVVTQQENIHHHERVSYPSLSDYFKSYTAIADSTL